MCTKPLLVRYVTATQSPLLPERTTTGSPSGRTVITDAEELARARRRTPSPPVLATTASSPGWRSVLPPGGGGASPFSTKSDAMYPFRPAQTTGCQPLRAEPRRSTLVPSEITAMTDPEALARLRQLT